MQYELLLQAHSSHMLFPLGLLLLLPLLLLSVADVRFFLFLLQSKICIKLCFFVPFARRIPKHSTTCTLTAPASPLKRFRRTENRKMSSPSLRISVRVHLEAVTRCIFMSSASLVAMPRPGQLRTFQLRLYLERSSSVQEVRDV